MGIGIRFAFAEMLARIWFRGRFFRFRLGLSLLRFLLAAEEGESNSKSKTSISAWREPSDKDFVGDGNDKLLVFLFFAPERFRFIDLLNLGIFNVNPVGSLVSSSDDAIVDEFPYRWIPLGIEGFRQLKRPVIEQKAVCKS